MQLIEKRDRPTWSKIADKSPIVKAYWTQWDSLRIENGCLKRIWESSDGKSKQSLIVVPKARVAGILEEYHGGTSGGHLGINKTLAKVRQRFYWSGCRQSVVEWCRKCDQCAAVRGPACKSRGTMKQYNTGPRPESVAIQETTEMTSDKVIFGDDVQLPGDKRFGTVPSSSMCEQEYIDKRKEERNEIPRFVSERIGLSSDRAKARYDIKSNNRGFNEGQLVWLYNPRRRMGLSAKLQAEWEGPYTVITRINDVIYRIQKGPRHTPKVVHLERLALYRGIGLDPVRDEQV